MIDEYGAIGHCDMSARLDNFAIELQNDPRSKAHLVAYDGKGKGRGRADWYLKIGRYYLVNVRGIDSARVAAVQGRGRDVEGVTTELWVVPEGAEPPQPMPAGDKYAAKDFSGKFDTYTTDELIYKEHIELGYSGTEISQSEFAEKLKQQPGSLGYLVIRTSKRSPPGTWRRVARREEQILQKDHGVAGKRLASLYGGQAEGDYAEVDLWVLPKSAPPPEGVEEKAETPSREAVRLNRWDSNGGADEDAEGWALGGIAEALRANPRATVILITREPVEWAYEGEGDESPAPEQGPAEQNPPGEEASPAGGPAGSADESAETDGTMKGFAEDWKKLLATKYGIHSWRIIILEGRSMTWSPGRLTAWLVPENARWPDPLALDEDEADETNPQENAGPVPTPVEPAKAQPR